MTRRWTPRSVRARATLLAVGVVAVTLVAASLGLLSVLRHSLVANRDDLDRARLQTLRQEAEDGTVGPVIDNIGEDGVGQVVTGDGRVLAASSGLAGRGPILRDPSAAGRLSVRTLRGVPDDAETEDYRVWTQSVSTSRGRISVVVGASLESVDEAVRDLRRTLLLGIPLLLVLVAAGTRLVVGRALRPVEEIRREVGSIAEEAGRPGHRVPVPDSADEVARLATTMNAMLARLESAHARQREFVGDASHELQTPLTALRAQLEVALAHPHGTHGTDGTDGTDGVGLAAELLVDVEEMERLVRDLLFLARDDAGQRPRCFQLVDLDDVVLEEVGRLSTPDGVLVDAVGVSAAPVCGDRDDLARLVRNVLENARNHARSAVRVRLRAAADGSPAPCVQLTVSDDGPGVPAEQRDRIFERFARAEPERSRSSTLTMPRVGTGLGLAIARSVARWHGGDVRAVVADPRSGDLPGGCFEVRLPAAGP